MLERLFEDVKRRTRVGLELPRFGRHISVTQRPLLPVQPPQTQQGLGGPEKSASFGCCRSPLCTRRSLFSPSTEWAMRLGKATPSLAWRGTTQRGRCRRPSLPGPSTGGGHHRPASCLRTARCTALLCRSDARAPEMACALRSPSAEHRPEARSSGVWPSTSRPPTCCKHRG
jgi:hypothetical protein